MPFPYEYHPDATDREVLFDPRNWILILVLGVCGEVGSYLPPIYIIKIHAVILLNVKNISDCTYYFINERIIFLKIKGNTVV
jgi:hypothetical protein